MAPPDELFGMDPEMKLITDKQYLSILFLENNPVDKNDQNEKKIKDRIQYYLVQSAIISFCKDQYLGKYFLNY